MKKYLVEWADKAMCYRWLHARSHSGIVLIDQMLGIRSQL